MRQPIVTVVDAMAFIDDLILHRMDWHFEDQPFDIHRGDGKKLSRSDCMTLEMRRRELYTESFDWGEHDCPIGYCLANHPEYQQLMKD
jgi:hypothetical protein